MNTKAIRKLFGAAATATTTMFKDAVYAKLLTYVPTLTRERFEADWRGTWIRGTYTDEDIKQVAWDFLWQHKGTRDEINLGFYLAMPDQDTPEYTDMYLSHYGFKNVDELREAIKRGFHQVINNPKWYPSQIAWLKDEPYELYEEFIQIGLETAELPTTIITIEDVEQEFIRQLNALPAIDVAAQERKQELSTKFYQDGGQEILDEVRVRMRMAKGTADVAAIIQREVKRWVDWELSKPTGRVSWEELFPDAK